MVSELGIPWVYWICLHVFHILMWVGATMVIIILQSAEIRSRVRRINVRDKEVSGNLWAFLCVDQCILS